MRRPRYRNGGFNSKPPFGEHDLQVVEENGEYPEPDFAIQSSGPVQYYLNKGCGNDLLFTWDTKLKKFINKGGFYSVEEMYKAMLESGDSNSNSFRVALTIKQFAAVDKAAVESRPFTYKEGDTVWLKGLHKIKPKPFFLVGPVCRYEFKQYCRNEGEDTFKIERVFTHIASGTMVVGTEKLFTPLSEYKEWETANAMVNKLKKEMGIVGMIGATIRFGEKVLHV